MRRVGRAAASTRFPHTLHWVTYISWRTLTDRHFPFERGGNDRGASCNEWQLGDAATRVPGWRSLARDGKHWQTMVNICLSLFILCLFMFIWNEKDVFQWWHTMAHYGTLIWYIDIGSYIYIYIGTIGCSALRSQDPSCYTIGILGDLHLDPRNMEDSLQGRLPWP